MFDTALRQQCERDIDAAVAEMQVTTQHFIARTNTTQIKPIPNATLQLATSLQQYKSFLVSRL